MKAAVQIFFLPLFFGIPAVLHSYEAFPGKEDYFASVACPAFLLFNNVAFLSDVTVVLSCLCKPVEAQSVVWYFQKELDFKNTRALSDFNGTSVVDTSRVRCSEGLESRFSIRLFSLHIYRAQEADSGYYICGSTSGQYFYAYYVDIQEPCFISFPQHSMALNCSPRQRGATETSAFYRVFTNYSEWTVCDRCGVPGEQMRTGLCYLSSPYLHVRYKSMSEGVNSCGSPAVPERFQLAVRERGAELEVRDCEIPCSAQPIPPQELSSVLVLLASGKKAGQVPVYYQNYPSGSHVILTCPGAKPEHAVAWDWGQVGLYRSRYMEGVDKSMRVYIDAGNHLHFDPVHLEDKGSYYCWLQGKVAAEIKLGVHLHLALRRRLFDLDSRYALRAIFIAYTVFTCVFLVILLAKFVWRFYRFHH
ncbi:Ig-like V-type domain-containing protein FAM187A [Scleropages formosus]|uniref:Family with sequence similarity 187 member A n=1 Tax=Scleropages formosus TaxID=113540 RepID=A0A8C9V844_SCLFO|nr:Ig-like V-type domain-containing protein FAM187A [Scleropages formosus]